MGLKKIDRQLLKQFIIEHVEKHPNDVVALTATNFGISRQAVHNHIKRLIEDNIVAVEGATKGINYKLKEESHNFHIDITPSLREDEVWREKIVPVLPEIRKNVLDICCYAFTEMLNNVIDHSESESAEVIVRINAASISFLIVDYGVGIFSKIQHALKLSDPKHAILELAKGKLTTDPQKHTGEGIFFTSRVCDDFDILSESIYFHGQKDNDWLLDREKHSRGTAVFLDINRHTTRTTEEIFNEYASSDDDYGFTKTKVPVKLLKYEGEELISRSQAKRLIVRFDKFKEVILDFDGVKKIGQPFADEIFRVFRKQNTSTNLNWINVNENIEKSIMHAMSNE